MEDYVTIKKLVRQNRFICFFCGKKFLIKRIFKKQTNNRLNPNQDSTFRAKLQLCKLSKNPLIVKCADKNTVRSYVESKIGKEYLIPQYFCKKVIQPEDLLNLPDDSFIIKTTSGSGFNIVVKDKNNADLQSICKKINLCTKIKYGYLWGEFFYNKIDNKIIAEKLLTKDQVYDYKVHCFRDNQHRLRQIIEVLWGPKNNRHKQMYDTKWEPLNYFFSIPPDGHHFKKPKELKKLLELAAKLSRDFNYVRVDFYLINHKIYFGELTFVPTAGFGNFQPPHYDQVWGNWIGD